MKTLKKYKSYLSKFMFDYERNFTLLFSKDLKRGLEMLWINPACLPKPDYMYNSDKKVSLLSKTYFLLFIEKYMSYFACWIMIIYRFTDFLLLLLREAAKKVNPLKVRTLKGGGGKLCKGRTTKKKDFFDFFLLSFQSI